MATFESYVRATIESRFGAKDCKDAALKICEEAGEVAGGVGKYAEGRHTLEQLDDELGDLLIAACSLAAMRGTTIDALIKRRWPVIASRCQKTGCAACDIGDFQLGHAHHCPRQP